MWPRLLEQARALPPETTLDELDGKLGLLGEWLDKCSISFGVPKEERNNHFCDVLDLEINAVERAPFPWTEKIEATFDSTTSFVDRMTQGPTYDNEEERLRYERFAARLKNLAEPS